MVIEEKLTEHSSYINEVTDLLIEGRHVSLKLQESLANGKMIQKLENLPDLVSKAHLFESLSMSETDVDSDEVEFLPVNRLIGKEEIGDVLKIVEEVLPTGQYTSGEYVNRFEEALKEYTRFSHCVTTSSGTTGLSIALLAAGVSAGDEVIMPSNSFAATENAVMSMGAHPVWVDIDQDTYCLDASKIPALITRKTKAILPVDLYGRQPDQQAIRKVADTYNLTVIEDGCQAIGSESLGEYSDLLVLSFNPYKNLGVCGKSGAILTNDKELSLQCKRLSYHGFSVGEKNVKETKYGFNARMDNFQAAIGLERFKYLTLNNFKRSLLAKRYIEKLNILEKEGKISLPENTYDHVWHLFSIRVHHNQRNSIKQRIQDNYKVQTDVYYPYLSHQQNISYLQNKRQSLSNTELVHSELLHLPLFPQFTLKEQDQVVEALRNELA
ncbi:3-dehydro-glucose-6-phosphate--glutamate transaminase [Geomicrobium halophilum]|uniref:3-dehydro-glucose-6-phosphate--glutamate transaminase n=1 Tax=Geomicrobium halophilum TaxID=549000 RepID=A0A841PLJ0_9BACL|nr:DegT/DnrJ/EryC1/StrS family aminotransferase [Geomicrobium halophilum]MBB6449727.1 3-dehydro-glucose-6-phosphate--glutamate transaminase [Geomicrobium halophilum]